jgi:hypothetical protein
MNDSAKGRLLLSGGYLVAMAIMVVPLAEFLLTVWPIRAGDLQWRFGSFGLFGNALLMPLIGVAIWMFTAYRLEHRLTLRIGAVITLLGALGVVGVLGLFSLDIMQMRTSVRVDARSGFDLVVAKTVFNFLAYLTVFAWVGITAYRESGSVGRVRRTASRREKHPQHTQPETPDSGLIIARPGA